VVNFTDRERWIAGRGRRSIEDARRRAAANTPEVMMSQTPEWYQNRENLSRAKDVLGNIPAVTTDQDESRNMYQMLMNQMKGGDKGARLVDESRTPYNPFPKAGFGEQFYKEQFPIASGLHSLMGLAEKSPTFNMLAGMFPKKERIPLERDPRFKPTYRSAYWEPSIFDLTGDYDVDTGYEWDEDIVEDEPLDYDWTELWMMDQEDDLLGEEEDITETLEEIIEEPEETTETFTDLGDTHDFTEEFGWGAGDYEDVQEYVTALVGDPDSTWYKMDQDELVKILIKQNRIKEK